jgi:hypothetical protein
MFSWPRLRFTLLFSIAWGLMLGLTWGRTWKSGPIPIFVRVVLIGLTAMIVFGLFEQWPRRLPRWLERWVLQVAGVAISISPAMALIYTLTALPASALQNHEGIVHLTGVSLLIAPWVALAALVRQKEALARHQALAFELERSGLERQALDARLRLMQAQVAPHFLFNTLANVQALVDAGSPQASTVLQSLINYLRAAVPRLNDPATTLGQELQLVRAYLELMHMRMPDRLQFAIHADESTLELRCPPMTLLTLVENAVRHGIDPSEEGGRIDIHVLQRDGRCFLWVVDTGAGLGQTGGGLGTGLSTLRERLQLAFGGDAQLRLGAHQPKGVIAQLDFPARRSAD